MWYKLNDFRTITSEKCIKRKEQDACSGAGRRRHAHSKRVDWEGISKMTGTHVEVQALRDMMVA